MRAKAPPTAATAYRATGLSGSSWIRVLGGFGRRLEVALLQACNGEPRQRRAPHRAVAVACQWLKAGDRFSEGARAQEQPALDEAQKRLAAQPPDAMPEDGRGLVGAAEPEKAFGQPGPALHPLGSDLGHAQKLLASLFGGAAFEEKARQVHSPRRKAGIDSERRPIVRLGLLRVAQAIGEKPECVMGRRKVGVEVARFDEVSTRSLEVAPAQLDEPEVHPSFGEANVVLEGEREAGFGRLQVAARERRNAFAVEAEGLGRQSRRFEPFGEPSRFFPSEQQRVFGGGKRRLRA